MKKGDIVKHRNYGDMHFIITDKIDFSKKQDGSDIVYEAMDIYPVIKPNSKTHNFVEKHMTVVLEFDTERWNKYLVFVGLERKRRGFENKPDYSLYIEEIFEELKEERRVNLSTSYLDDLDNLKTIDDCLDAMNDLKSLEALLGGKEYPKMRRKVLRKLKGLI